MGLKCGIVGLPNVGKSTLFNALTDSAINADNYPFCTIEPNVGTVPVPDQRLQYLASIVLPKQIVPATVEFIDIAGLVEGASKGEGLGNKFLSHIRETQAIVHVVRCFYDDNVTHVAGKVDPMVDIALINTELCLADQQNLNTVMQKTLKLAKSGSQVIHRQQKLFEKAIAHLNHEKPIRSMVLDEQDSKDLESLNLLTQKPVLYIANIEDGGLNNNLWLQQLEKLAADEGCQIIPVCMMAESEITKLDPESKLEFLHDIGFTEPGLNRIICATYSLLKLHSYFTTGVKEVRAWTLRQGNSAQCAASVIHTDFGKGFIRAEVIAYQDFIQYGGEQGAKDAGKWRLEGKEYIVNDGDVIHFRFNV